VLGACLGLAVLSALVAEEVEPDRVRRMGNLKDQREPLGVASCAAYACHGGNQGEGDLRSAYTTWMALDPHSRAESVLREPRSIDIQKRLAAATGRAAIHADADARCLGCHVSPARSNPSAFGSRVVNSEGVGCESCHGAASKWLEPHSTTEWRSLSDAKKTALGMVSLAEPESLVQLCVGCHVGGPGRDVDHDLIAAGHPRLDFEALAYLQALPRHWDEAKRRRNRSDLDARTWAVGQLVSARQALALLGLRAHAAQERQTGKPIERSPLGIWPEFAEYACTSCHHPLTALPLSTGRETGTGTGLVGLPWGTWFNAIDPSVFVDRAVGKDPVAPAPLTKLRQTMESIDPPPTEVEQLALDAQAQLSQLLGLARGPIDRQANLQLLTRLVAERPDSPPLSWESATQRYLGIAALTKTLERLGQPIPARFHRALEALKSGVAGSPVDEPSGRWTAEPFTRALGLVRSELAQMTANVEPAPNSPSQ